jgi:hypothetical protein
MSLICLLACCDLIRLSLADLVLNMVLIGLILVVLSVLGWHVALWVRQAYYQARRDAMLSNKLSARNLSHHSPSKSNTRSSESSENKEQGINNNNDSKKKGKPECIF